jgi:hypothetical protein
MAKNHKMIDFEFCPACLSRDIYEKEKVTSLPGIIFPVTSDISNSILRSDLIVYSCLNCSHIFQNFIDCDFIETIYREYYQFYPFDALESFEEPYRVPFLKLAEILITKNDASLLEIGSGNEEQLRVFYEKGLRCTAVNPGTSSSKQVHFIDGFYENWNNDDKFEYIISRFNLEHIMDLDLYFNQVKRNLEENGLMIVQVPNVLQYISLGLLNIYAHEHIHYFNPYSLRSLIERHGFEIKFLSNPADLSILCAFSNPTDKIKRYIENSVDNTIFDVCKVIENSSGPVVLYGAGLSTSGIMYNGGLSIEAMEKIIFVDDNPKLRGLYLPFSKKSIKNWDDVCLETSSLVILTLNSKYHLQIIKKIKLQKKNLILMGITSEGLVKIPH